MESDRQAIVQMLMLGRLSPGDAERLLLAWNEGRETAWLVAGCVALALIGALQTHAGVAAQIGRALSLVIQIMGGLL